MEASFGTLIYPGYMPSQDKGSYFIYTPPKQGRNREGPKFGVHDVLAGTKTSTWLWKPQLGRTGAGGRVPVVLLDDSLFAFEPC